MMDNCAVLPHVQYPRSISHSLSIVVDEVGLLRYLLGILKEILGVHLMWVVLVVLAGGLQEIHSLAAAEDHTVDHGPNEA